MISILLCISLVISICLHLSKKKFDYWKKRNVPHLKPLPIFGNYKGYLTLQSCLPQLVHDICEKFPKEPYIGAYYGTEPALIVQDPEYIKLILTKDFYYFNSREVGDFTDKEIVTQNLFFTNGDRWKIIRQNFTPLFSSAKMKKMFYLIEECCHGFEKMLNRESTQPSTEVRSIVSRYTIDCIGTCVFGLDTRCMTDDANNPFFHISQLIFETSNTRAIKYISRALWPSLFYKLGFTAFPTEISDFFKKLLLKMFDQRQNKNSGRHDFVDLVLTLKQSKFITGDSITNMKGDVKKTVLEVDNDLLCAQCSVFFAAGYETSSATMSYLLYELAKHPDVQKRAIAEADEYFKKNNKIAYECVQETPFIEACVNETLRLYPVLGVITREVVEDYSLPSGVQLDKGTRVHIPVFHIHRDPRNFPDPDDFRPERFLGSEKNNIKSFTYMPFGEGPRICIGMRFARMQMTAGLLTILKNCRVETTAETPKSLVFEPRALTTQPINGIHLKFVSRNNNVDK